MNKNSKEIFNTLIKAAYNNELEEKIHQLLEQPGIDKQKLSGVISSLCGVTVEIDDNYFDNLKKAIYTYKGSEKVVQKISSCSMKCASADGKTNCQKSCPFDAILIDKAAASTYIDNDKCIGCGLCVEACNEGNIMDKAEFIPFAHLLKENVPVIAAVAPAICGQFGEEVTIDQLRAAFKKLGFTDMFEVAFFADMLTLKEAVEFDHHVKSKDDLMITSCCCPMWVGMIKKVYGSLVKYISPSISPMIAAGRILKKLNPECKVVFIGPCIAKKSEAKDKDIAGAIDYVLTFEELKVIFDALSISPADLQPDHSVEYASQGGRFYGFTGGVSTAVSDAVNEIFPQKHGLLRAIQANGVKECKEILLKAQEGNVDANFIEGMGCVGGCVGGPKVLIPKDKGRELLKKFGESSTIKVATKSDRMLDILKRIGINSVEDFKKEENISILEREF